MRTASWMRCIHSEGMLHKAASIPPKKRSKSKVWDKVESQIKSESPKRWPGKHVQFDRETGVITIS